MRSGMCRRPELRVSSRLVGTTFPLGTAALIGGILLFNPLEMPLFAHSLSGFALRSIGAMLLWGAIAVYMWWRRMARRR